MFTSSQWIKKNMMGLTPDSEKKKCYTKEYYLQKVKRCIEQLHVPEWYQNYSKPMPKILKNNVPIDCRPARWRTYRIKRTPRKALKLEDPKPPLQNYKPINSVKDAIPDNPRTSSADSGFNETYRIRRKSKTYKRGQIPSFNIATSSSSEAEFDTPEAAEKLQNSISNKSSDSSKSKSIHNILNSSNTYPRVAPSRKIENINIVFSKPFPPQESESMASDETNKSISSIPKIIDVLKKIDINDKKNDNNTNNLIKEVEALRLADNSLSHGTRFFDSMKSSGTLEKTIENNRKDESYHNGSMIKNIINELDRSIAEKSFVSSSAPNDTISRNHVRNMVNSIEKNYNSAGEENDKHSTYSGVTDSDISKSTTLSVCSSSDESTSDELPTTPFPPSNSEEEQREESEGDEDVYWIPTKILHLPRTSSRISIFSTTGSNFSMSNSSRSNSPGLSPIKKDKRERIMQNIQQQMRAHGWGMTYKSKNHKAHRELFSIDEKVTISNPLKSGFSDQSNTTVLSSRMDRLSLNGEKRKPALDWSSMTVGLYGKKRNRVIDRSSVSSTPTIFESSETLTESQILDMSGPFVLKSFLV